MGILTITPDENPDEHKSYDLGNPEDVYSLIKCGDNQSVPWYDQAAYRPLITPFIKM